MAVEVLREDHVERPFHIGRAHGSQILTQSSPVKRWEMIWERLFAPKPWTNSADVSRDATDEDGPMVCFGIKELKFCFTQGSGMAFRKYRIQFLTAYMSLLQV